MTSKNDYLTTKFFHLNALSAALTQADVFLRCEPAADRDNFRDVYYLCVALVFIGECLRFTTKKTDGSSNRGRIKFMLQNILRFFVFDFEAEFAAKFDTYNKIAEHVVQQRVSEEHMRELTNHLTLAQYEFVRSDGSVAVESFADLFKTLKVLLVTFRFYSQYIFLKFLNSQNRVVIIFDNVLRDSIQTDFKTHARQNRVPKKFSVSSLITEWVSKREEYIASASYSVLTDASGLKTEVLFFTFFPSET